jgi:hypothetical protein
MATIREHARRTMYNHARSKEQRAPVKPSAVHALKGKQHDEKTAMGQRHRREGEALRQKLDNERVRDLPLHNDPPDAEKRRRALDKKHESERNNLAARHNRELEAAAAKEHID